MAITYIIFSLKTNRFYTGSSSDNDINFRLGCHNSGKVRSTKFGGPWKVVHVESVGTNTNARKRELFLKSGVGRKWVAKNFAHWKNK